MSKTILHVSKYYYPYLGGIETLVKSLTEGMTDYCNIVVCFATDGCDSTEKIDGVTVHRVKVNFSLMSQDVAFGYYKKLKQLMNDYQPDYVHVHCPNPFVYPLVMKAIKPETKLILHWHSDILSKGIMYNLVKPFETAILKRCDKIIATSPNYIHPSSPIFRHKDKIYVVPSGIICTDFDLRKDDEERVNRIRKSFDNKPIVLFTGRHIPYKGIDWLLDIEKLVKSDCRFVIVGSGPLTEQLKARSTSARVTFTGRLSADELRCYSYAADIFAFTSRNKAEAFGLALAEAMYCRCVPIVFHIEGSGVNWVSLNDKTGIEVPLGDLNAYAAAIDGLLSDLAKMKQLADAARRRVIEMFTAERATSIMKEAYKTI